MRVLPGMPCIDMVYGLQWHPGLPCSSRGQTRLAWHGSGGDTFPAAPRRVEAASQGTLSFVEAVGRLITNGWGYNAKAKKTQRESLAAVGQTKDSTCNRVII